MRVLDVLIADGELGPQRPPRSRPARGVYSPAFTSGGTITEAGGQRFVFVPEGDGHDWRRHAPAGRRFERHGRLRPRLCAVGDGDVDLALERRGRARAGAGITSSGGVTFTENAGTTFSSMRLSPL